MRFSPSRKTWVAGYLEAYETACELRLAPEACQRSIADRSCDLTRFSADARSKKAHFEKQTRRTIPGVARQAGFASWQSLKSEFRGPRSRPGPIEVFILLRARLVVADIEAWYDFSSGSSILNCVRLRRAAVHRAVSRVETSHFQWTDRAIIYPPHRCDLVGGRALAMASEAARSCSLSGRNLPASRTLRFSFGFAEFRWRRQASFPIRSC